jgi:hypothetical protein
VAELHRFYVEDGQSIEWLIAHYRSAKPTVRRWLREAGIRLSPKGSYNQRRKPMDPEIVCPMYIERGMTICEIVAELHSSYKPVARALKQGGVTTRRSGHRRPEKSERQPRCVDIHGYVLIYSPDHPQADKRGWMREHRLVMEKHLGRLLLPEEVVHHKDDDKSNNAIENLQLLPSQAEHIRLHNLEMSTARGLKGLSDADVRTLYSLLSTVQLARAFETSPATVQRELQRRGITMLRGVRPAKGPARRRRPAPTATAPPPTRHDDDES